MRYSLICLIAVTGCGTTTAPKPDAHPGTEQRSAGEVKHELKAPEPAAQSLASERVVFDAELPPVPPMLPEFKLKSTDNSALFKQLRGGALPDEARAFNVAEPQARARETDSALEPRLEGDGSFEIYASFESLAKESLGPLQSDDLREKATRSLKNLLPADEQPLVSVDSARVLYYARLDRRAASPPGQPVSKLLYLALRRRVEVPDNAGLGVRQLPVDGPGSRIVVALDATGKVRAASFAWKRAIEQRTLMRHVAPQTIKDEISRALLELEPRRQHRVQQVRWVYHDDGESTLQPVLRYVAEPVQARESIGGSDHIVGYLPYDPANQDTRTISRAMRRSSPPGGAEPAIPVSDPGLLVGRFVTRDDIYGFDSSSEAFSSALAGARGPLDFRDLASGSLPAEPPQFIAERDRFVNAVDFALVEGHGFPWGFTTRGDSVDPVFISLDVPPLGRGSSKSARLRHWLLHSCESLPIVVDDQARWARPWWRVFDGMSSVLGYRTSMFVADGAPAALAPSLRWGAAVVPAWFTAVASLNIYALDAAASYRCAGDGFPVGRASALNVCGRSNAHAAVDPSPGPARCLEAWWLADELSPKGEPVRPRTPLPPDCPTLGGPVKIGDFPPHP